MVGEETDSMRTEVSYQIYDNPVENLLQLH